MFDEFNVVLYDPFFDEREECTVEAEDLDGACEIASAIAEGKGVEVEEVAGPDGEITYFSTGRSYAVEAVTVVHTASGEPTREVIHALTFDMALDLAQLMFGETSIVSIDARDVSTHFNTRRGTTG